VVLVPEFDVDETQFARQIWSLVSHQSATAILLVCLVNKYQDGPESQRRLVTLAALTQDSSSSINTRVVNADNWLTGLQGIVQPGDLLVCQAEQKLSMGSFGAQSLAEGLTRVLPYPVAVLTGLWTPTAKSHSKTSQQILKWVVLLLIVGGFFAAEVNIQKITVGWLSNLLFIAAFALEIGSIWVWFSMSNPE
jgi:hypothetical protein